MAKSLEYWVSPTGQGFGSRGIRVHITAAGQSLILAGESLEVDNLAKRATLVKGPGGDVVVSGQPQQASTDTRGESAVEPGPVINYELWVNSGVADSAAPRPTRTPVDLYKRTFHASQPRPKIVDVFA